MKHPLILLLLAAIASHGQSGQAETPSTPGLSVSAEGVVFKDGRPYHGIGVNYYNAYYKLLIDPADTSYQQGFKQLAEHHIPYVRLLGCGFWPVDLKLYQRNKVLYFRGLDAVVHAAEENHVGLIPSLFWAYFAVPDLVGEPMDQWGNAQSKTRQFMRQYTEDVVRRYRASQAIWAWEFGNEWSLTVDLPNGLDPGILPPTITSLGDPATRGPRDVMTSAIMIDAFKDFAATVRRFDPGRMIVTGNSIPRPGAWHNTKYHTWDLDTRDQFAQVLLRDNPDPLDSVTVHIYYDCDNAYFQDGKVSIDGLMKECRDIAATVKKPLFVGEFGAPASLGAQTEHDKMVQLLTAIEGNDIPLSAAWTFTCSGSDANWDITTDNARAYILDLIGAANARIWQKFGVTDITVPVELSSFSAQ